MYKHCDINDEYIVGMIYVKIRSGKEQWNRK